MNSCPAVFVKLRSGNKAGSYIVCIKKDNMTASVLSLTKHGRSHFINLELEITIIPFQTKNQQLVSLKTVLKNLKFSWNAEVLVVIFGRVKLT